MSLHTLHTHRPNPIFHGDARLPNLIVVDGRLVWIDLMRCSNRVKDSNYRFSFDMHTLVHSLFPSVNTYDDQALRNLIDSYSANPSPSSIEALEKYLLRNLATSTGQLKG
jgi:tRNA A-37 threonylcarbamoyl transferase component Bud32